MIYLSSNIRHLRKKKGLTQAEFADKINVNRAMVGSYEEDRAVPKLSVLRDIAYFFFVSVDELLSKDFSNEALEVASGATDVQGSSLRVLATIVDRDDRELITLVPVKAAAGYASGYGDPEYIASLPVFSLPLPELSKERTYRAFQIKGDSMEPVPSGSYIVAEYLQNWKDIRDGKTYIVVTLDDGVVFKRLYNYIDESGELLLKSDNPVYEPYRVNIQQVVDVWKAIGYICFSMPEADDISLHKLSSELLKLKDEINNLKKSE